MPTINEDLVRTVIAEILADSYFDSTTVLAKDANSNKAVRPGGNQPNGVMFPQIVVRVEEGPSESVLPASSDTLIITYWINEGHKQGFLETVKRNILRLFNRKGSSLNNIDIPTNTGVRYLQIVKQSAETQHEDRLKLDYLEIIFAVIRSEGESFDPADAGDKPWV